MGLECSEIVWAKPKSAGLATDAVKITGTEGKEEYRYKAHFEPLNILDFTTQQESGDHDVGESVTGRFQNKRQRNRNCSEPERVWCRCHLTRAATYVESLCRIP